MEILLEVWGSPRRRKGLGGAWETGSCLKSSGFAICPILALTTLTHLPLLLSPSPSGGGWGGWVGGVIPGFLGVILGTGLGDSLGRPGVLREGAVGSPTCLERLLRGQVAHLGLIQVAWLRGAGSGSGQHSIPAPLPGRPSVAATPPSCGGCRYEGHHPDRPWWPPPRVAPGDSQLPCPSFPWTTSPASVSL